MKLPRQYQGPESNGFQAVSHKSNQRKTQFSYDPGQSEEQEGYRDGLYSLFSGVRRKQQNIVHVNVLDRDEGGESANDEAQRAVH